MAYITAMTLEHVWERAIQQVGPYRALMLLLLGEPEASREELANLPVSERDRRLLQVRERLCGPSFESTAECPHCGERIELAFDAEFLRNSYRTEPAHRVEVEFDGWKVRARFPTTADLLQVQRLGPEQAAAALMQLCVEHVQQTDEDKSAAELPYPVAVAVEQALAAADPMGDPQIDADCPACNRAFNVSFDIARYLWQEVDERVWRLQFETHTLARAYGWSETEILSMSEPRRQRYLDLVAGA
jgi:hypothetical protein